MKHIDIAGIALEVAHIPGPGGKAPLIFLHEGLGSVAMWHQRDRHWPSELCASTQRPGWLFSRRGYGQSDPVTDVRGAPRWQGVWHIGRHEADYMHHEAWKVLPTLLEKLAIPDPVLVGHSDGATIALLYASRYPVVACVAIAPHVFVEDIAVRAIELAKVEYEKPDSALRQRLARYHADVDNAFRQWNDVWLSPEFRGFDIRKQCQAITAPLLLVQGLGDAYGTLAQLDEIARAARHARRVELADCGHSPHRDQPIALTNAISQFLNDSL